jgi:hypothetical protein
VVDQHGKKQKRRHSDERRIITIEDRTEHGRIGEQVVGGPRPALQIGGQGFRIAADDRGQSLDIAFAKSL